MTSFSFRYRRTAGDSRTKRYRRTVGRDDWIDLFAMLTAPLRRRSGFKPFTGILPSASPPSRTALFARFATALVRINAFGIFKTKKTP